MEMISSGSLTGRTGTCFLLFRSKSTPRHCGALATKRTVILPGEDQDPLAWVRRSREIAQQAAQRAPRLHQQHNAREQVPKEQAEQTEAVALEEPDHQSEQHPLPGLQAQPGPDQHAPAETTAQVQLDAQKVATRLGASMTVEDVLERCESLWPEWASNGCWLLDQEAGAHEVPSPSPSEAAAALQIAAEKVIHQTSGQRLFLVCSQLAILVLDPQARERQVLGLVEALRVAQPRTPCAALLPTTGRHPMSGYEQPTADVPQDAAQSDEPSLCSDILASTGALDAHGTARAIWALAVFGGANLFEEEMEALLKGGCWDDWKCTPAQLANITWALGVACHCSPSVPLIEQAAVTIGGLARFKPREATSLLWGFATLAYTPAALLDTLPADWALARSATKKSMQGQLPLAALSAKQLATCAWALAAMEQVNKQGFGTLWAEILRRGRSGMPCNKATLMQIHQVGLAVALEGSSMLRDLPVGPEGQELLSSAKRAWDSGTKQMRMKQESYLEKQIASTVVSLGLFHCKEDNRSGYSVDISLPDKQVAIEADGPSHLSRTLPQRQLGRTQMKHRHLRLLGWQVVSVPYVEWDELEGPTERREYLLNNIGTTCG